MASDFECFSPLSEYGKNFILCGSLFLTNGRNRKARANKKHQNPVARRVCRQTANHAERYSWLISFRVIQAFIRSFCTFQRNELMPPLEVRRMP